MPDILCSVVIPHRSGAELLRSCLSSIREHEPSFGYELVVVDNASEEGSVAGLRSAFPELRVLRLEANSGFGAACNRGAEAARGRFLLFLNDDTLFLNDALGAYVDFYQGCAGERIGALGPRLRGADGGMTHSFGSFPDLAFPLRAIVEKRLAPGREARTLARLDREAAFPVDYLTGAALFVERSLFLELGGFDEGFFMYFEDTELQFRMAKKGFARYCIAGPRIAHLGGGGAARPAWVRIETYRSLLRYYSKTESASRRAVAELAVAAACLAHFFNREYSMRENIDFIKTILFYTRSL